MRALITGGSGYIGSRVMRALAERDDVEEIVDVDVRPPRAPIRRVTHVERSVTSDLRDLFAGPRRIDVALHFAWTVDPLRDARRQREICIGGTERFLAGCEAGGVPHVFFVSSATAYGAHPSHDEPLPESAPLARGHLFQYAAEKAEAEGLFGAFGAAHPEALVQIVRPVVVAGPHVDNYIFRTMRRTPALRPAFRDPRVQLVHEDDCARAMVAVLASRRPGAFNLAADGFLRLSDAFRAFGVRGLSLPVPILRALAGVAFRLGATSLSEAPADFVYFVAEPWLVSNRRIKEEIGFRFEYDAAATLASYVAANPPG